MGLRVGQIHRVLWSRLSCGRMAGWKLSWLTCPCRLLWQESQPPMKKPTAFPCSKPAQPCLHGVTTPGFPHLLSPRAASLPRAVLPNSTHADMSPRPRSERVSWGIPLCPSAGFFLQESCWGAQLKLPVVNPCSEHSKSKE